MNEPKITKRLKIHTCEVVQTFFYKMLNKTCTEEIKENYVVRNLPLIFLENGEEDDMIGVVISDNSKIIMFCKEVLQKTTTKKIRGIYTVPKRLIQYIHYPSGNIISDSISELYNLDPEIVSGMCSFFNKDDEEIIDPPSINRLTIKIRDAIIQDKISVFLEFCDYLTPTIGYYTPKEAYSNIRLCLTDKKSYTFDKKILEYSDDLNDKNSSSSKISKLLYNDKRKYISELNSVKSSKTSQTCCIEIAKIIIECLFPILFNT